MKNPLVAVIVTTRNEERNIGNFLESVKEQTYKPIEVLVVDNNSTDKTKEIAKGYTKDVFNKGPERSVQRNYGVSKSKGKYVLVLDSDMILEKKVVEECVGVIGKDSSIGAVIIPEKSFGIGFWARAKALERELNEGEEYFEAARFFPKKVFKDFGGYDTTLTGPEDWDLPQRISKKYEVARIGEYIRHNEGKTTIFSLAKRKYYYGLSVYKYLKKQKMSIVGPKTLYFLRRGFYKNWKRLFKDPFLSLGMVFMLLCESFSGGLGYLVGRFRK